MKALEKARDKVIGIMVGAELGGQALEDIGLKAEEAIIKAQEGRADLELATEDVGWQELNSTLSTWNFSRSSLMRLMALARVMYIINPLIKRAVTVQELYVWGSGCHIKADDDRVNEVLQDFFEDQHNQQVIGSSWPEREREQRIDGNTFFSLFRNKATGACRIRTIPTDMVADIICNPDDIKEPWFYKKSMEFVTLDGYKTEVRAEILYPDIDYNPISKPSAYNNTPIDWDVCVLHVKTGGLSTMRFGMPEIYSALAWATAYKRILENFATILAAYARMAMAISGLGKKKVAAAKSKLQTSVTSGNTQETNPSTTTASWFLGSGNADVKPIKTAGSTTGPDEARALRSMVAAGTDTPEHFFGDSDIGNFATSSTLDRPTELKMVSRQGMWGGVIYRLGNKVIEWSARAPQGTLREAAFKIQTTRNKFDRTITYVVTTPQNQKIKWTVTFPTIIERDVTERVRAVVAAATLNGSPAEGIIPDRRQLYKLIMIALGEKDVDGLVDKYYPEEVKQGFIDPAEKIKNETLDAQGKRDLGKAAIQQAEVAKIQANKPTPAPAKAKKGAR